MSVPIENVKGFPVIGRYYLVWCIEDRPQPLFSTNWLPIIGPLHNDLEYIGVPGQHWHYDFRFLDRERWEQWTSCTQGGASMVMARIVGSAKGEADAVPVLKHRRCLRQMPEFPIEIVGPFDQQARPSHFAAPLEAAYANTKLKSDCKVCPHRGVPLYGLPVSPEGNVTCPGHGLRWNLKTRELVRRVPVAVGGAR